MNINCGECARYRKDDCRPDKCLPGDQNKLFLDPMDDPKKYCYLCSSKLKRQPTKKYSGEYREIPLKCPTHGVIGYIHEQFTKKEIEKLGSELEN